MSNPPKVYLLSDGTSVTAQDVAKRTGISLPTARVRLCKYTDPVHIFKQKGDVISKEYRYKKYILDDGTELTVKELADKTGMTRQQAGYRLCKYTDPKQVYKKINTTSQVEKTAREKLYATKPINDEYHRMFMMMA